MVKAADHIASRSTSVINKKTTDKTPFFQAKLTVNEAGDQYEKEADTVADKVMRMPDAGMDGKFLRSNPVLISSVQRKCAHCEEEEKLQKKEDEERSEEMVQSKKAPEFSLQRKCDACEQEENIQRKGAAINSAPTVSNSVHQTLGSTGQPLDAGTRGFMESRFGYDFSNVRIHNDMMAHRSSKDLYARAYTHGEHIVFGSGQYQPKTKSGKQLLAHELTHVVQQGGGVNNYIQRAPLPDDTPVHKYYYPGSINVDVKGKSQFQPGADIARYIDDFSQQNQKAIVNIQYGTLGQGDIFVTSTRSQVATETNCDYSIGGIIIIDDIPIPIPDRECHEDFDPANTQFDYNAPWQIFPIKLPGLDTSKYDGTLVMGIAIESGNIKGKLGWIPLIPGDFVFPGASYDVGYGHKDFLPLIYGKDYTGQDFTDKHFENELKGGVFSFTSFAEFMLPSFQKMSGILSLGDQANGWSGGITADIVGAEEFELEVDRSDTGDISGEDDGITINEDWKGKGFTAAAKLHATYVNSHLSVTGEASYESKRASGKLFLAVTDYETAKKYAADYLPEEIAALARADKPAPDKVGHLAFVGAGKLGFILFDGKKNTEKGGKKAGGSLIGKDNPEEQKDIAPVTVDTSFVVEPEGYITVAGQIKQPTGKYELFKKMDYTAKKFRIASFPVSYIPLPIPGTYFDFDIALDLLFGAHIGPLTLSQLAVSGIYSNHPGAFKELELSGFVELAGGVFAKLILSLNASVGAGPFTITVLSKEITFSAEFGGTVSARPTIRIRKSDTDSSTPREYYIKGNFDFDAAGKLAYQINDSFKANANEKKSEKVKTPRSFKYLNSTEQADKNVSGRDIELPMDNSLGSEEAPDVVSVQKLKDINLETGLNKIIKGRKTKKYFEEGVSDSQENKEFESPSKDFGAGEYMEGGQKRGHLGKTTEQVSDNEIRQAYEYEETFHMMEKPHILHLIVDLKEKNDKITTINQVLTMSSPEEEELSEKIKVEKEQIQKTPDATSALQEKDLEIIEGKEKEIKAEVKDLAINGQLSADTKVVELLEMKVLLENRGKKFNKSDLGNYEAKTNKTAKPKCKKPDDLFPGQKIIFKDYNNDGRKLAIVIDVVTISTDPSIAHWYIKFKYANGPSSTNYMPRAFNDDDCKDPTYIIYESKGECITKFISPQTKHVPSRYLNGENYYGYEKAKEITAVPLCVGDYLSPEKPVVGIERIRPNKNWHRAHLLHGELGGRGIRANLIPTPKYFNENTMPNEYESKLWDLVIDGKVTGKYYWFKAEVSYHDNTDNFDIGYYEDFVKEIKVFYGEAIPKNDDKTLWEFVDQNVLRNTLQLDYEPSVVDMKPSRTSG